MLELHNSGVSRHETRHERCYQTASAIRCCQIFKKHPYPCGSVVGPRHTLWVILLPMKLERSSFHVLLLTTLTWLRWPRSPRGSGPHVAQSSGGPGPHVALVLTAAFAQWCCFSVCIFLLEVISANKVAWGPRDFAVPRTPLTLSCLSVASWGRGGVHEGCVQITVG